MEPYFCSTYTPSQPEKGKNLLHPFSLRHCKGLYGVKTVRSTNKQNKTKTNKPMTSLGYRTGGNVLSPSVDSQIHRTPWTHKIFSSATHYPGDIQIGGVWV
jgi:hypothetical protein